MGGWGEHAFTKEIGMYVSFVSIALLMWLPIASWYYKSFQCLIDKASSSAEGGLIRDFRVQLGICKRFS